MKRIVALLLISLSCSLGSHANRESIVGSHIEGTWPSWSPDGEWLLYSRENDLWLKPLSGGEEKLATALDGREYQADWDPSNPTGRLVFINSRNELFSIMTLELEPYRLTGWYESDREVFYPCFSRDGKTVMFLEENKSGVQFIDSIGGEPTEIHNGRGWGKELFSVQASRIADSVIYVIRREDDSFGVESIPISGGDPETIVQCEQEEGHSRRIYYAAESPDGGRVAYYEAKGDKVESSVPFQEDVLRLMIYDKTDGNATTFKEVGPSKYNPFSKYTISYAAAWSPDSVYLAHPWIFELHYVHGTFDEVICVERL